MPFLIPEFGLSLLPIPLTPSFEAVPFPQAKSGAVSFEFVSTGFTGSAVDSKGPAWLPPILVYGGAMAFRFILLLALY